MTVEIQPLLPLPIYYKSFKRIAGAVPQLKFSGSLSADIARYCGAYKETARLLYGEAENQNWRGIIRPDLDAIRKKLDKLTDKLGFDCVELASLMENRPNPSALIQGKTGVHKRTDDRIVQAALAIKHAELPEVIGMGDTRPIQDAVQVGDADFFVKLGKRLDNLNRHTRPPALDDIRVVLYINWSPGTVWPGLAYCENAVRMAFCHSVLTLLHHKSSPSKGNFDQAWRRMGFRPAKRRFIKNFKFSNEVLIFS